MELLPICSPIGDPSRTGKVRLGSGPPGLENPPRMVPGVFASPGQTNSYLKKRYLIKKQVLCQKDDFGRPPEVNWKRQDCSPKMKLLAICSPGLSDPGPGPSDGTRHERLPRGTFLGHASSPESGAPCRADPLGISITREGSPGEGLESADFLLSLDQRCHAHCVFKTLSAAFDPNT